FTNRQMAEAVTDFVLSDPTLRPGSVAPPGLMMAPMFAAGPWSGLAWLGTQSIPAYAIEWKDDPYSTDLSYKFREALRQPCGTAVGLPHVDVTTHSVPFSTGRLNRPTQAEAEAAEDILANLPPPGIRTVLVVPTVAAPARRTMRTLVQGNAEVGRQLV